MKKETQTVEFKVSWRDDFLRVLCGMANANGGRLYIGVDDHGKVVGVLGGRKLLEDIFS